MKALIEEQVFCLVNSDGAGGVGKMIGDEARKTMGPDCIGSCRARK